MIVDIHETLIIYKYKIKTLKLWRKNVVGQSKQPDLPEGYPCGSITQPTSSIY